MTNTRRMMPVFAFGVMIILSAALANLLSETEQIPIFIILLLLSMLVFLGISGAGIRRVERSTFVVRRDMLGTVDFFDEGAYLYLPYIHKIEAIIPSYAIRHEFPVGPIDTRSTKLAVIDKVVVRVTYHLVAKRFCHWFYPSFAEENQRRQVGQTVVSGTDDALTNSYYAFIKDKISDLEAGEKLRTENPELWTAVLNKAVEALLDDMIRDQIWDWQEMIIADESLKLAQSYENPPKGETDPYVLDLNRRALARIIRANADKQTHPWGLRIQSVVFEEIKINDLIIKVRSRNRPGEISDAEHESKKEAIAIKNRGMAEAEVRAEIVGQIITRLAAEKDVKLTDELIYNIVRAVTHGDGQLILSATTDKNPAGTVKAA